MHAVRALLIAAAVSACGATRKDTLVADVCSDAPPALPTVTAEALDAAARAASHVVRGRVRWTGIANDEEGAQHREYVYVVVDVLEFYRGDAWSVEPRMQRSFPLLAERSVLGGLACRNGEAFFFFVDLPEPSAPPRPGGVPDPVFRAFGDRQVRVHAIVGEAERDRVAAALAR